MIGPGGVAGAVMTRPGLRVKPTIVEGGGPLDAGTITASPGDQQVSLAFSVAPSGGTTPYTYQWRRGTVSGSLSDIVGATSDSYVDTGLTNETEYFYECVVDDGATSETTAEVSATPSAVTWPNEPVGYTLVAERSVAVLDEDGWNDTGVRLTVEDDATAPASPTKVLEFLYPDGEGGPGLSVPDGNTVVPGIGHQELYVAFFMKVVDPWQEHSTDDSPKLFFGEDVNTGGQSDPLVVSRKADGEIRAYVQNSGNPPNRQFPPSPSVVVSPGSWAQIEAQIIMNSQKSTSADPPEAGTTNADGVLRIWVEGTLVIEVTDIWFSDAASPGWTRILFNPIWGGQGDQLTQNNFLRIDHFRISGVA